MVTLFDRSARDQLKERLERVRPDAAPQWGRMNAHEMVCHLGDQLRVAIGEISTTPKPMFLRFWLPRQLFVYWLPWPKGKVPTDPKMLSTKPVSWDEDMAEVAALVDLVGSRSPQDPWAAHPAFGQLSGGEWGKLCARHLDHHLTQFGV